MCLKLSVYFSHYFIYFLLESLPYPKQFKSRKNPWVDGYSAFLARNSKRVIYAFIFCERRTIIQALSFNDEHVNLESLRLGAASEPHEIPELDAGCAQNHGVGRLPEVVHNGTGGQLGEHDRVGASAAAAADNVHVQGLQVVDRLPGGANDDPGQERDGHETHPNVLGNLAVESSPLRKKKVRQQWEE